MEILFPLWWYFVKMFVIIRALNSNKFTGRIPASLGLLSNLYWFDLGDNQLTGVIPISSNSSPGLDLLVNTKHLFVSLTLFSSSIQHSWNCAFIQIFLFNEIAAISTKTSYRAQYQKVSSVPRWLLYICKLFYRFVISAFSPFQHSKIFFFKKQNTLDICRLFDSNKFTGQIPKSIGLVTSLEVLWVFKPDTHAIHISFISYCKLTIPNLLVQPTWSELSRWSSSF